MRLRRRSSRPQAHQRSGRKRGKADPMHLFALEHPREKPVSRGTEHGLWSKARARSKVKADNATPG